MNVDLGEQPSAGALQRYIDELLGLDVAGGGTADAAATAYGGAAGDGAGTPRTEPRAAAAAGDGCLHFLLVSAGGLRVALPAEAVGDATGVRRADVIRTVDLAARLRGNAPADRPSACLIALAAYPDIALAVDAVEGPLAVAPESLTRRDARAQKPWLTGMIDAHRAIVIAVDQLIGKENDRGS